MRIRLRNFTLGLAVLLTLGACAEDKAKQLTRWESYYARTDQPRAHVVVKPPYGTTVPMANLIAENVVDHLTRNKMSAVVGRGKPEHGQYYVLNGLVEQSAVEARTKYPYIIRWSLSDSQGRLISSHAEGIVGSQREWDFGSPRLLNSIGISTAAPIAQMVLAESKTMVPLDPLRQGLMVENVQGLPAADGELLSAEVRKALRRADVQVTGDPRQATFRLVGDVEITPQPDGFDNVRIVWRVTTMDYVELGNAVQENKVEAGSLTSRWPSLVGDVAKAAAVGVEYVFGNRSGPLPGAKNRAGGAPPEIILPGVPGRAPPPPR